MMIKVRFCIFVFMSSAGLNFLSIRHTPSISSSLKWLWQRYITSGIRPGLALIKSCHSVWFFLRNPKRRLSYWEFEHYEEMRSEMELSRLWWNTLMTSQLRTINRSPEESLIQVGNIKQIMRWMLKITVGALPFPARRSEDLCVALTERAQCVFALASPDWIWIANTHFRGWSLTWSTLFASGIEATACFNRKHISLRLAAVKEAALSDEIDLLFLFNPLRSGRRIQSQCRALGSVRWTLCS